MKALVIGQGGREHAIVKALVSSASIEKVYAIPGSSGMKSLCECHKLDLNDFKAIADFAYEQKVDFVVIGPEDPLVQGLSNYLRQNMIWTIGPSMEAAQLEGSKIFSKEFMNRANIPTAGFKIVKSTEECLTQAQNFKAPFVLKADGLAAGKGVFICQNEAELKSACTDIFEKKIFGAAGLQAALEEFIAGYEISYLILTNGAEYTALPLAQDHKRLLDKHQGPNTGGMGVVAPLTIESSLEKKIVERVIQPTLKQLTKENLFYRGVLYIGLMIKNNEPYVLEYNCRFGDPETQAILPLIENDLGVVFQNLAKGQVTPLKFKNIFSTCVVMAAPGYPFNPQKELPMTGDPLHETSHSYFIHAGSVLKNDQWLTSGGRVLCAMGLGSTRTESKKNAYAQAQAVHWKDMIVRKDIGNYVD